MAALAILLILVVGFLLGYAVREIISQRRRVVTTDKPDCINGAELPSPDQSDTK
jgi:hypothetical protein